MHKSPQLGIVLSAGGARAAYQVGVIKYMAENFPHFQPTIFSGVSAGSINACFLAQGDPIGVSANELCRLWNNIEFNSVFQTQFSSLFRMGAQWVCDLFLSKFTKKLLLKSLLNAAPLSQTLLNSIYFKRILEAVASGKVKGIAVSATNYYDGSTTIFYDSHEKISPWRREQRRSIRTVIRVRHIMASCSIPILFEPVRIGDVLYGDGSIRFGFPLSPAIKLGATHVLAIGIRCPEPETPFKEFQPDHLGLGFIAGCVLNSIFLDSLESDYENLCRVNQIREDNSKRVHPLLLRPSQDLGRLATNFIDEVPFHFRQFLRATANADELGDLLSYLMFCKGYIGALTDLGMKDAAANHDIIKEFLKDFEVAGERQRA